MQFLAGFIGCFAAAVLAGQGSPWDNVLVTRMLRRSMPLFSASPDLPYAGVPCMCRGPAGEIVQMFNYFPGGEKTGDYIGRRRSFDDGQTWTAVERVTWSNGPDPDQMATPADPSVVLLDDGTWRLYFTCHVGKDPYPLTWSATSADGLHFVWEEGKRMQLPAHGLLDPSVIFFKGEYHFFAPRPGMPDGSIHATSLDGVNFKRLDDVVVEWHTDTKFLGNPMVRDGELYFYGTLEPKTSWAGVFAARSSDAINWTVVWSSSGALADPAAIETANGVLLVVTSLRGEGG